MPVDQPEDMAIYDKVSIDLTRDSVCAGDDADAPHKLSLELVAYSDPTAFLDQFAGSYLASVNGVGHWWRAFLNGTPVAIITVNGIEPLIPVLRFADDNSLFFEYHSANY